MIYLLDANAITDLMADHPRVGQRVASLGSGNRVAACVVAWGEVLFGIERLTTGKRKSELAAKAAHVASSVPTEPIPADAKEHYARIKTERQRAGRRLDENDLWIAAAALALGATIVTRDSDFVATPGLLIVNWAQ
jgi:tRNA(fMet)-specific endonuclease VapC